MDKMWRAPECIIMTLILMVTCSTYYLHWQHGPKTHDHDKYRFRKPHVHAGCNIEADCSIYSTCVSGKCVVFWPALRSNITCQCLSDIINYEDHFYLKTVSSVQYHNGPTSKTCVVTYRWGPRNGTGSTVKEYEERDSGALLRRESISGNSASLVALCKNIKPNAMRLEDKFDAIVVQESKHPRAETSCLIPNTICDKIQIGKRIGFGIVKQVFEGQLAGDDIVIKTISETQIDRVVRNQPYLPFYKLFKECELLKLLMKEHPKHSIHVYGICLNIRHNDNDGFNVNPGLILERGASVDFNHRDISSRFMNMLHRMSNTTIGTIEITDIKREQFVQKNNDIHCIDLGDVRFHRDIDKQQYYSNIYKRLNIRKLHEIETREPVQLTMKQSTCDIQRFTKEAANLWWIGNEQGKQWNPEWLDNSKKFAYVWWTSKSEYTWSALVAIKSLKSTNPSEQIDFVLIHTIALSDKQKQLLDAWSVKCISFENTVSVQNSYFKYANNKLYIFKLTQYAKVLFMDSDSMPLQNLDHMFMFPDAPVVAPCSYWEPKHQPKLTAWILLVQPSHDSFDILMKRAAVKPKQTEMDTINDVFKKEMILLPSYYGLLNSEWENDGNIAFHNHDKDIYTKAPIVHYTIKGKPWQHAKDFFKGKLWDIEANLLHNRWWDLRESLNLRGSLIVPQIDKLPPCFELLKPDSIFVKTGDIPDMWIRDSTAQVWPYRAASSVVEKVLNTQSFFILQDPYANSYRNHEVVSPTQADLKLGRKGWVATRNYELDSGCYFVRLLHYAWKHHDLSVQRYRPTVETLVNTWKTEQRHEENSPYRYTELPRNGLGTPVTWTGMTWSGFRPSDDACQYGYHIPSNFFAAEALASMLEMFPAMEGVAELRSDILIGIQTHGVWKDSSGVERYCYEVDGLGNCNKMDDANVPSLLSIPYLSPRPVNRVTWKNTYDWIWSSKNPYFFEGKAAEGIGSPHTPHNYIWPMSIIMRGIVDPSQCQVMKALVEKTMTRNTIHESFDKDNAQRLTREDFAWPNALYQEMDCKPSVSIGIPAIWDDKNVILDAIKSAEQQTVLPKEIVIVMSGVPANEHPKFDSSLPMRIFTENTLRYAGWARNKIASVASGEWIAYIDADDTMHRKRIETFYALYTSKDILVLHSHATNEKTIDVAKRQIISGDQLLESARQTGNTMPLLPDGVHNIHHGHPIVKKTLFDSIKYDEGLRRGQDTEFLHRAIQYLKGQGVKYIHAPLSIYVTTREAKSIAKVKDAHTVRNEVINSKNIIWSRNWHNLVTCPNVPASYYNAGTETRHSAQKMIKYFSKCGGFLWVRSNSQIRPENDITTFATHVLPLMSNPFILITSDGDNSVPLQIHNARNILDNPLCKAWYTQNFDGTLVHQKLKPIPIGFDLHTNWKGLWSNNVSQNLNKMLQIRKSSLQRKRDDTPFVPPWSATHNERIRSDHALECLHHVHGNRMGIDKLWETYGSKTFALSPQGNGLDCHRTWELLFFGVIPIVKSVGGLDILYKDLPVVIVKDWTDVCAPNFFNNQRDILKDRWPMSLDKFKLDYWVQSSSKENNQPLNIVRDVRDVELYGHYAGKKVPFYMYSVPKYTSCIEGHSKIYNWYKRYKHGGELWWYEQLTRSPWRTSNPTDAKVFVMPLFTGLSAYKNICKTELQEELSNIKSQESWNNGIAHLLLTTHFTTMNIDCGKCIRFRQANTNRANQGHISTPMVGQLDFEGNVRYHSESPIPFWNRNNVLYFAGQADKRDAYTSRRQVKRVFDNLGYPFIVCSAKTMPCAEKFKENMFNTKFGMHIRGDLPSSSRLYEWISTQSIPIMVSDTIFEGWLPGVHIPWHDFSIQIKENLPDNQLEQKLKEVITMDTQKINTMLETLGKYRTMLMWQHPKSIVSEMLLIDAYEYLNKHF